jgi:hypothetical protein
MRMRLAHISKVCVRARQSGHENVAISIGIQYTAWSRSFLWGAAMKKVFFVSFLMVFSMTSCRKRVASDAQGPGMNASREATLLADASREIKCPTAQLAASFVETVEPNFNLYRVDGCGQTFESFLHCTGFCSWRDTPNKLAAAALQCPQNQLLRSYLGNATFSLAGCGRAVNYQYVRGRLVPVTSTLLPVVIPAQPASGK